MKRFRLAVLPLLGVAAVAAGGCGSSSQAPPQPSGTTAQLSGNTPVAAPVIVNRLVQIGLQHGLSSRSAHDFARCVEKQLASRGVKTYNGLMTDTVDLLAHFRSCFAQSQSS